MIIKGEPGGVVQKMIRKRGGRRRIVPIFRFDENGLYEFDENKFDKTDIAKLLAKFELVEQEETDEDIRKRAKDAGIKSWHVKSIKKLKKELEG